MHSNCEGESPTTPTPDVVSQILEIAESAKNTADSTKSDLDDYKQLTDKKIQAIIVAIQKMGGDVTGKEPDNTWLLTN